MGKGKAKSATELAMRHQREAYIEERCKPTPVMAAYFNRQADELLALPGAPDIGPGGEVVRTHSAPDQALSSLADTNAIARHYIRDTLAEGATRLAEDASIKRADLLLQPNLDAVALGIDAAESIGAANALEKMLAHQMAVAHEVAMQFADRAVSYQHRTAGDQVEAARCANAAARMMGAFQSAMLTLQKIRSGGNQTVTVQHVNVQAGGQAVIGNVKTGGRKRDGGTSGK